MLRVFLVEDERIIRETLHATVPWARCGYQFVGEAADGEMALPLIRQTKPDVLITDIRMPFVDGLSLSRLVLQEFPQMKIIILSGYDDFEYAQQAISIGVERYLLKPITKNSLVTVLDEVRQKIEGERAQQNYLAQFHLESQDYEDYARCRFFEQMVNGLLTIPEIYQRAEKLDLDLRAQAYTICLISAMPEQSALAGYSETSAQIRDGLVTHFLKYPEYVLFRWNLTTYAVLIKGDEDKIGDFTRRCVDTVRKLYETCGVDLSWYVAAGKPQKRLSALPECFRQVSRLWSYRYVAPSQHIFTEETVGFLTGTGEKHDLSQLDVSKLNPAVVTGVLENAAAQEVSGFVDGYIGSLTDALSSGPFCQYLMLSVRFCATEFVQKLGYRGKARPFPAGCEQAESGGGHRCAGKCRGAGGVRLRGRLYRQPDRRAELRPLLPVSDAECQVLRHGVCAEAGGGASGFSGQPQLPGYGGAECNLGRSQTVSFRRASAGHRDPGPGGGEPVPQPAEGSGGLYRCQLPER